MAESSGSSRRNILIAAFIAVACGFALWYLFHELEAESGPAGGARAAEHPATPRTPITRND